MYTEYTSSTVTNIAFRVYKFNTGTNQFAIQSGDSHDYSCSSSNNTKANIDADWRGFFVFTWESGMDLHTVAGKIKSTGSHIRVEQELTLTLPSGTSCNDDITKPDVAIFSQNTYTTTAYVYYTYIRCQGNQPIICEQTYNYDDILTGTSAPSILSSYHSDYISTSDYGYWGYPRIAANQYFTTGQSNAAVANEFTIVCSLDQWLVNQAYMIGSIFAMTATYNGSTITYSQYNLNSASEYLSRSPYQSMFYNFNGGTPYNTVENAHWNTANYPNTSPAVTYDRDNENIVVVWNMIYAEGTYSTLFPYCAFPSQTYVNPAFDGNSTTNSSNNPVVGSLVEYRSLDNTAAQSTSNTDFLVATNSHNTQDIVYAWHMGGTIRKKVLTSGTTPRFSGGEGSGGSLVCYPNPASISNTTNLTMNLIAGEKYTFRIYSADGKLIGSKVADRYALQYYAMDMIKKSGSGIYNFQIADETGKYSNCRVIAVN